MEAESKSRSDQRHFRVIRDRKTGTFHIQPRIGLSEPANIFLARMVIDLRNMG